MSVSDPKEALTKRVHEFILDGAPNGDHWEASPSSPDTAGLWPRMRELGSELWLDSGDVEDIQTVWDENFSGLTTNNTLLNREVQKGTYDDLILEASRMLDEFPTLPESERKLELAFILNARHGLMLVTRFGAKVSVEEHTDLSHDIKGAIRYARRFHALCPEKFLVKIPFSAAGLLAARAVRVEGIPVNQTLGFSARQNHLMARISKPNYVNVFLGRLNSFVADNDLGDGSYVGEKALLASQAEIDRLSERADGGFATRQIAASLRNGEQVRDLAGVDVLTMPPKVARQFLELGLSAADLQSRRGESYPPGIRQDVPQETIGANTLWDVTDKFRAFVDELDAERLEDFTETHLEGFFKRHGFGDALIRWTDRQVETSRQEGKIPQVEHWKEALGNGSIGLDSLMNLAGYNSFDQDQREMDQRVQEVLASA